MNERSNSADSKSSLSGSVEIARPMRRGTARAAKRRSAAGPPVKTASETPASDTGSPSQDHDTSRSMRAGGAPRNPSISVCDQGTMNIPCSVALISAARSRIFFIEHLLATKPPTVNTFLAFSAGELTLASRNAVLLQSQVDQFTLSQSRYAHAHRRSPRPCVPLFGRQRRGEHGHGRRNRLGGPPWSPPRSSENSRPPVCPERFLRRRHAAPPSNSNSPSPHRRPKT